MSDKKNAKPTEAKEKLWRHAGLSFECTACGDCCTGDPGYVWLNKQEIADMAKTLDLSDEEFRSRYVRDVGVRKSLMERANGDCVLFNAKTRKCTVYKTRPRQCQTWPFWDSNLKSPEAWAQTCEVCPGCGQGQLYSLEEIEKLRRVIKF